MPKGFGFIILQSSSPQKPSKSLGTALQLFLLDRDMRRNFQKTTHSGKNKCSKI